MSPVLPIRSSGFGADLDRVLVNGQPIPEGMEGSVVADTLKGALHWASRMDPKDGFMVVYDAVEGFDGSYRLRSVDGDYEAEETDVRAALQGVFPNQPDFVETQMQRLQSFGALIVNRKTGEVFTR